MIDDLFLRKLQANAGDDMALPTPVLDTTANCKRRNAEVTLTK